MKKIFGTIIAAAVIIAIAGCSSGGGGGGGPAAPSTSVTLSGSLKINGQSLSSTEPYSVLNINTLRNVSKKSDWAALTASYRIACATFEDTPKSCGGDVASTGAFSVECSGFAGIPFGCFVYNTSTYKNYSIVFNVTNSSDSSNSVNSGAGTASIDVNIDTVTGLASADVTLPSVGAEIAAVTAADLAKFDGSYKMAPQPWSVAGPKCSDVDKAVLKGKVIFYKGGGQQSCPTGSTATSNNQWDPYCEWTPTTEEQGYNFAVSKMSGGGDEYVRFASVIAGTFTVPSPDNGMPIFFKGMTINNEPKLTIWESESKYNTCVSNGSYNFRITDGTTSVPFDLKTTVTGVSDSTVVSTLLTYMGTQLQSAINAFAPVLNALDIGATTATLTENDVTCKIPYAVDYRFWNSNPAQLSLCSADSSQNGCASYKNNNESDYSNALWRYKNSKLYSGTNSSSDAIISGGGICPASGQETTWNPACDFNFSDNVMLDTGSEIQTGLITGWTNGQPTITATSGATTIQLGGCLQWEMNNPKPTIVPEGKYFNKYDMNGNVTSEKCTWNESRLVVAGTDNDYQFEVGGVKYKEATNYVVVSGVNKQVYNKICSYTYNSKTFLEQYPSSMTKADIVTNFNSRAGGRGNSNDRNGMKFGVLYKWIAGDGGSGGFSVGNSESFYYNGGALTCANLVAGSLGGGNSAAKWGRIGEIVSNLHDDWMTSRFISCLLVGLANNSSSIYSTILGHWAAGTDGFGTITAGDLAIKTALATVVGQASYQDANGNNVPDKIDSLRSTSCMPKVQVTRVCTSSGCGENQVICNSATQKNGGCDNPLPNGQYAVMDATAVGSGKFVLFNLEERYNYQYDPSTNSGKICTQVESMTITNETAVTDAVATGTTLSMMFDMKSSSICDGDEPKESAEPKQFFYFKKQ